VEQRRFDPELGSELVDPGSSTAAIEVEQHAVDIEGERQHRRSRGHTRLDGRRPETTSRQFGMTAVGIPRVSQADTIGSVDFCPNVRPMGV
jgi:hypothetical protein